MFAIVLSFTTLVTSQVLANENRYFLFKQQNPNIPIEINQTYFKPYINPNSRLVFIVHGWSENHTTPWYEPLKNALIYHRPYTDVVEVDYGHTAQRIYPLAAHAAIRIGVELADFIIALGFHIPYKNIELIGHSLGGQVVGFAGYHFQKRTNLKLSKITALDPAGPFFRGIFNWVTDVLSPTAADIVVVIHTDQYLFGTHQISGTIDIFPNGGEGTQPGCPKPNDTDYCSHHQSYWYYISAVENPGQFLAWKCESYEKFMDRQCDRNERIDIAGEVSQANEGKYYVRTFAKEPYYM